MNGNADQNPKTKVVFARGFSGGSLKQFLLGDLIGEGGMGQVYRAQDTRLHRPVAVKVLSPEITSDPDKKQRLLQEARAAARINHPTIAQIYDADEQEGTTFIVLELIEGSTIQNLIANRELDLLGAIDVAIQVADGLAKAHQLGIVHRDIKPANVMLTPDSQVKILDFGLAKVLDPAADQMQLASTRSGMVMGTAAYMSPEQARGLPVDPRTDVFSLGVLLYEMVTCHSPFERDNFMNTLHAVAFEEPSPLSSMHTHVPDALQHIVSRCLQKQPADRYPDARQVAQELRRVRRDTESGLARRTTWRHLLAYTWTRLRQQPRSRYLWLAGGFVGLGLALYLSTVKIGLGGMFFSLLAALYFYRYIRNNPSRTQQWLLRRLAKIPEVRLVAGHDRRITVVVDRSVAQLYSRINTHLATCNSKLFYGAPMTISIMHDVSAEQFQKMLGGPGVLYVREDAVDKN
jgi:serine/threonine protein kinase